MFFLLSLACNDHSLTDLKGSPTGVTSTTGCTLEAPPPGPATGAATCSALSPVGWEM